MSSSLMLSKSTEITLKDVKKLPEPKAVGRFHKPIHPYTVVHTVDNVLKDIGHDVKQCRIAINPKSTRVIATYDIVPPKKDKQKDWSIGIMTSVDRTSALKGAGGGRVLVCDNLMVVGDLVSFKKKHTKNVDIEWEIRNLVEVVLNQCKSFDDRAAKEEKMLMDMDAGLRIFGKALVDYLLPANHVRDAAEMWVKAELPDVKSRSLWGIHSSFTRQIQKLNAIRQFPASVNINKFCEGFII